MATPLTELQISLEPVVSGLEKPVHITNAGDNRLFVVEQSGQIRTVQNGQVLPTPFLDISDRIVSGGEQGLLSVAFSPNYASNGFFYVNYTQKEDGATVISRFQVSGDRNLANASSEEILMIIDQPFPNHNGGQIAFDQDGFLYIGMGDGGAGGDPQNNAQDPESYLGKMLRIDVESTDEGYAIPTSNPFVGAKDPGDQVLDEIWASGLRNPWRFSFDRLTDDLYIGDVGQNAVEEISFQPANSLGGENYGWRRLEGSQPFDNPGGSTEGLVLPIAEYSHSEGDSVTGGYVFRGDASSPLYGVYLYADFSGGKIWGLRQTTAGWENALLEDTGALISTFGEDRSGNLYLADYRGTIHRITATAPAPTQPVDPSPTDPQPTDPQPTDPQPAPSPTAGDDILSGTAAGETLRGLAGSDRLSGLGGGDRLVGGAGDDTLLGGNGQDTLLGQGGNDVLFGGRGSDGLTGGIGRDTFALEAGAGRDRFTDFRSGVDRLGLTGSLRFNALDIVQRGNNTLIRANGDALALLEGVSANQLDRADFTRA